MNEDLFCCGQTEGFESGGFEMGNGVGWVVSGWDKMGCATDKIAGSSSTLES
jgi:hypothetical protein